MESVWQQAQTSPPLGGMDSVIPEDVCRGLAKRNMKAVGETDYFRKYRGKSRQCSKKVVIL